MSTPLSGRRRLRIVSVNDVYSLENLPRLRSLVRHHLEDDPADKSLVVLAGDFVAPSLLSSIDAGRGMVDCMNAVGVTHVVLGNHEDDLPPGELWHRLRELNAVCLGTNVSTRKADLPRRDLVDVGGLRVGLIGVVMTEPTVYRGAPFGGAILTDANDSAIEEARRLLEPGAQGCAAVVAITHQTIDQDKALAERAHLPDGPRVPVIVGGHEHVPMLLDVEGTWIVKAGSDAAHAVVTEIVWPDASQPRTWAVTTRLDDVAGYPEDATVRGRVTAHMAHVDALAKATLLYLKRGAALSSVGTRSRQTSLGELICSKLRFALGADACVFNGGGIRASRDYPERLTYGDVEAEVPFENEIVVVAMPGKVLRDAVTASRAHAPAESGSFLQVDDAMRVDEHGVLVAVSGAPLDPERDYRVALVRELLLGLDRIEPLVHWAKQHPEKIPPAGSGREPKLLLVQAFAIGIWHELGGFDVLDANRDEQVTVTEVADAVSRVHPSAYPMANVLADIVVRAIDTNADRIVSREEAAAIEKARDERADD